MNNALETNGISPPEIQPGKPRHTAATREVAVIEAPRFQTAEIICVGVAPLLLHAFSEKARKKMEAEHRAGSQVRSSRRKKEPRDFEAEYEAAIRRAQEGWAGVSASAFRNAMISACRLVGFKMTVAKLAVFIEPDGFDANDGTPLVRIEGEPRRHEGMARNESGVIDIRHRPMWEKWRIKLRVRWDADQFSSTDIANLLTRAGMQVGIGEGRPDSPNSNGLGFGLFRIG